MKPVVMTAGKRVGAKQSPDKLTLQVMFPRAAKTEMADIDLINGEKCQIIVRAPEEVEVHFQKKQ